MAVPIPDGFEPTTGTVLDRDDGVIADRTDDGAIALRQLYPAAYYDISLQWRALTTEKLSQIEGFFADNRMGEIEIELDDSAYHVKQIGGLRRRWTDGAGLADLSLNVRGTRVA